MPRSRPRSSSESKTVPVVVDLWAPWCGPCRTLGPIIEKVVDATDGKVVLVKVNVDENPAISQAFRVQSIPAVYAMQDGQVVDGFVGAYPEHVVQRSSTACCRPRRRASCRQLIAAGDEASLRQALELEPGQRGRHRRPRPSCSSTAATARRRWRCWSGSRVRAHPQGRRRRPARRRRPTDDYDATLDGLLDRVKDDDDARQEFVDILELMGPDDPRTADYRRRLTAQLF